VADILLQAFPQLRNTPSLHRRVQSVGQLRNAAKSTSPITETEAVKPHRIIHRRGHSTGQLEARLADVTFLLTPPQPDPITTNSRFTSMMDPDHGILAAEPLDDMGSSTEFPNLSPALLRTVTAKALRKVPPIFPDEPLEDCDVLDYYERVCDFSNDSENTQDDQEQALMDLGLTRSRRRALRENLHQLANLYDMEPEGLWKIYDAKTMMVWIVAGAVYASTLSTSGQGAGGFSGGEQGPGGNDSREGASNTTGRGAANKSTGVYGGGNQESSGGGAGGRRRGDKTPGPGKGTERLVRDAEFLRFPRENEEYFTEAKEFFEASPHHTEFTYADVEYPEHGSTLTGTSAEPGDEAAQQPGAMWSIKTNPVIRSVYHGLPAWEYSRLIEYGHWNPINSRWRGELSGRNAVYFCTSKEFALFFSAFKSGIAEEEPVDKLAGVVIETPLPPSHYALVLEEHRENFAVINRKAPAAAPIPGTPVVVSGFLKRWAKKYANRSDLGPIMQSSHQLAVVDWTGRKAAMDSLINMYPSHIAIINAAVLDFRKRDAM
jgi:hypothetical protein